MSAGSFFISPPRKVYPGVFMAIILMKSIRRVVCKDYARKRLFSLNAVRRRISCRANV